MTGLDALLIVGAAATIGLLARAAVRYQQSRGVRAVTCPETKAPVLVQFDALKAAFTVTDRPRLRSCTRWPERQDCDQECRAEIAASWDGCRVSTALERWYGGKTCALCGKPLNASTHTHRPALLDPQTRVTTDWNDIPASGYPDVLATTVPVCWDCHVTETFRRTFPHLVIERHPNPS